MLIIKGDTVLDVTPKAYEVIYKEHDFTIQAETEEPAETEETEETPAETEETAKTEETPAEPIKPKAPAKKAKAKAGDE